MVTFSIDDPVTISDHAGIEVTVDVPGIGRRWCVFMTPTALSASGDVIAGARVHYGERHVITVSTMTSEVIRAVLEDLERSGELLTRTLPLQRDVT